MSSVLQQLFVSIIRDHPRTYKFQLVFVPVSSKSLLTTWCSSNANNAGRKSLKQAAGKSLIQPAKAVSGPDPSAPSEHLQVLHCSPGQQPNHCPPEVLCYYCQIDCMTSLKGRIWKNNNPRHWYSTYLLSIHPFSICDTSRMSWFMNAWPSW